VKGDGERAGQIDQGAGARHVHRAVWREEADDGARCARAPGCDDVPPHDLELGGRVAEIAAAGADDHVFRNGQSLAGQGDGADGGRQSALEEVGAEFDATGAALLGGDGRLDGIDAHLEEDTGGRGHGHLLHGARDAMAGG